MTGPDSRPAAPGLRERKKERTRQALSDAAVALFMERGFDAVSVAEVAAAAEVSKPTLFRYFPAKEDLVLHRFADHEDESARVVTAGLRAGTAPLDALYAHLLDGLDRRDPVTGLCDHPAVLSYLRLLYGTPALVGRLHAYRMRSEAALADALAAAGAEGSEAADPLVARLGAGQIVAVLGVLAEENTGRIAAGETADEVAADAVAAAGLAFRVLREGLPY
ncbi:MULTISPECIES: TetR/AcrR family transcriptional regulator [Streptomyces]|uniref:Transcriptional regulator, TetR family n=1 Tax=Streptomyces venezuelae (strain ATCC 10712 / CBS 650.69 / DSM 40230 / JCM 4526 / NBRC 13096 / PD 04745) TaxID=953739 RepID=F2RFS2_STRVP|nr:TetR family transcriptional regulator [Streptomyces venezuelae]APE22963.1 TetR family transcriptional regulator [Streptomyces venezuelae]QES00341.1 TetR family transcriptional regulator [Streptomyces venezuelae ATCC 10712]QES07419.1 TetR family transcriptional regulator [Streptomyces venezuelae]CCA57224.1 Transcriptional regulator, TetR family [Streptomyces venezuelae ATCC 10712]